MDNSELVIIGAGGHAKVVIQTARAAGFDVTHAYDDSTEREGNFVLGVPVSGPVAAVPAGCNAIIAIGQNESRQRLASSLTCNWATIAHPSAIIDPSATVGAGTVVFAGTVIQADAQLGRHVILNTGASVDHDSRVADHTHVGPGARICGNVTIGAGTLLGVGSCVIPGITIGAWSTIGAGATVVGDIPSQATVGGTPARSIG